MPILNPLGQETLTRIRASFSTNTKDNTRDRDWANATQTPISNCYVEPPLIGNRLLVEDANSREYVDSLFKAYLPGAADVVYTDRLLWRGETYEIRSQPQRQVDFDGNVDHIQLMMELKKG